MGSVGVRALRRELLHAYGLWRLMRLLTAINAVILLLIGSGFWSGHKTTTRDLPAAAIAMVFLVIQAQTFNDLVDMSADARWKRWRPLPAGLVTVPEARTIFVVSVLLALGIAWHAGPRIFAANVVILLASVWYSIALKSVPIVGNLIVALSSASPLIVGALATGFWKPGTIVAAATSTLYMWSYETVKTAEDREGDSAVGIRTVATVWGHDSSMLIAAVVAGCSAIPVVVGAAAGLGYAFLMYYLVLAVLPVTVVLGIAFARGRGGGGDVHLAILTIRLLWYPCLVCFILTVR